ncbi:hypothetical protein RI367_005374 [Sorochytrium milnesiophthora]
MDLKDVFKAPAPKRKPTSIDDLESSREPKMLKTGVADNLRTTGDDGVEYIRAGDDDGDDGQEEGGRFFGDGLSAEQREILELVDQAEDVEIPTMDLPALKKLVLRFERAITKNQELRVKHADDPIKFLDSEVELDAQIHAMATLATGPQLYPQAAAMGVVSSLLGLLQHENLDIAMATIELLNELTDEDVLNPEEDDVSVEVLDGIRIFVKQLVDDSMLELMHSVTKRLDLTVPDDRAVMFKALSILENILSVDSSEYARTIVTKTPQFVSLMVDRMTEAAAAARKNKGSDAGQVDEIAAYCAELVAVLTQSSDEAKAKVAELGGIDMLLQLVAVYKRKDPRSAEELEFMENGFNALCACLADTTAKRAFREGEGFELMFLMIKERKASRIRAVRVCDHALAGSSSEAILNAAYFVEHLGLRTIFPIFMHKDAKKLRKQYKDQYRGHEDDDEHVLSILASLLRNLQGDVFGQLRHRVLHKFYERGTAAGDSSALEKVHQLVENIFKVYLAKSQAVPEAYAARLQEAAADGAEEEEAMLREEMYIEKLAVGGFTLSMAALILAEAALDNAEVRDYISQQYGGEVVTQIKDVLRE